MILDADELANTWLSNYNGSGVQTETTNNGGRSLIDIVKELCTEWNPFGVEAQLHGDTLSIKFFKLSR